MHLAKLQAMKQPDLFKPPDPPRPRQVTTNSTAEFNKICDAADAGLLFIEAVVVGKTPSQWIVFIGYPP